MRSASYLPMALVATGITLVSTAFSPAKAASFSFSIDQFTGDDTKVDFFLQDITGGVEIQAAINTTDSNVSGDISGIWFDIANDSLVGSLDISGANLTGEQQSVDNVNDLGGGVNLNGGGSLAPLDVGVKIGANGNDNIEQTTLTVLGNGLSTMDFIGQAFGVRIKSSGPNENGSSKLAGFAPSSFDQPNDPQNVPEPTAILGSLVVVGLGFSMKRKQNAFQDV